MAGAYPYARAAGVCCLVAAVLAGLPSFTTAVTTETRETSRASGPAKPGELQRRFDAALKLAAQKHTAEAIEQFRKLSDEYPKVPEFQNNLAVLYVERGELDKAQTALEAALKGQSSYETIYRNLSNVNARRAAKAYAQALSLDTSKSAPVAGLSMITAIDTAADPLATMARADSVASAAAASLPTAASTPASAARPPAPMAQPQPAPVAAPTQIAIAAPRPTPASTPTSSAATSVAKPAAVSVASAVIAPTPHVASAPVAVAVAPKPASAVAPPASAAASSAAGTKTASAAVSAPIASAPAATAKAVDKAADEASVRKAVLAWANAWQSKDVAAYVAAYAPGFKGAEASPAAWQAARRVRIVGKKSIDVKVSGLSVKMDATYASATFTQAYTADQLKLVSRKTLNFELRAGRWLITRESATTSRA